MDVLEIDIDDIFTSALYDLLEMTAGAEPWIDVGRLRFKTLTLQNIFICEVDSLSKMGDGLFTAPLNVETYALPFYVYQYNIYCS